MSLVLLLGRCVVATVCLHDSYFISVLDQLRWSFVSAILLLHLVLEGWL